MFILRVSKSKLSCWEWNVSTCRNTIPLSHTIKGFSPVSSTSKHLDKAYFESDKKLCMRRKQRTRAIHRAIQSLHADNHIIYICIYHSIRILHIYIILFLCIQSHPNMFQVSSEWPSFPTISRTKSDPEADIRCLPSNVILQEEQRVNLSPRIVAKLA